MADDGRWTSKLPTLVIGVTLVLIAAIATSRRATVAAIVCAVLAAGFISYSLTIKEWCSMKGTTLGQSPWGQGFGGSFDECLKAKGWLSF